MYEAAVPRSGAATLADLPKTRSADQRLEYDPDNRVMDCGNQDYIYYAELRVPLDVDAHILA